MDLRAEFIADLKAQVEALERGAQLYQAAYFKTIFGVADVAAKWIAEDRETIERLIALIAEVEATQSLPDERLKA